MRAGDIVAERFELERLAGEGGMGAVYRAHDGLSGAPVALKVLHHLAGDAAARFVREARVLAELTHPAIVRYVAHGTADTGEPYLAMEWLDGEDLETRLAGSRRPTDLESVTMMRRLAEALGMAHSRGVVHRDIKPSNIFLERGEIERVKVLDFGIARMGGMTTLTTTGMILGTPGYMAPEQARGEPTIDARADVYALGCVLFECLTGRTPFVGAHGMAVLMKTLFEQPPRARDLRDQLSASLDALLARMLAKDVDARPADGAAVARQLAQLESMQDVAPAAGVTAPAGLSRSEQRMVSVVVAAASGYPGVPAEPAETREFLADQQRIEELRQIVGAYDARLERLLDGTVAAQVSGAATATEEARRAARCALAIRKAYPRIPMVLATGRRQLGSSALVGEVIDRAVEDLNAASADGVRIDDVTAGLLDARFEVHADGQALVLHGEREVGEGTRTLLGKPTPCVGRALELSQIESVYQWCVSEPAAGAVLITAPAGFGKSRLRHELQCRLREAGQPVEVLLGRGDPQATLGAYGLIAAAIRRWLGILHGEPLEVQRQKLKARFGRHLRDGERSQGTELFGELIGVPLSDQQSTALRAARSDARAMAEQIRAAWLSWLRAECRLQPVVLLLEDLHWADLPSVKLADAALGNLGEAPFMVLALARPEVHQQFPDLWSARHLTEIKLRGLSRKASAELARSILGEDAGAQDIDRIVEQAEGNAFFLEELIRAAGEGRTEALPETVLGMVEARIGALEPDARRVLRAASVFGQAFWRGGIVALLGGDQHTPLVDGWLSELARLEIVSPQPEAAVSGEREYRFRHALVREAAYAMLTAADRVLGHRLAAEWLESVAAADPIVLGQSAGHIKRVAQALCEGGDCNEAASLFARAGLCWIGVQQPDHAVHALRRALELADVEQREPAELVQWLGALSTAVSLVRAAPDLRTAIRSPLERIRAAGTAEQMVSASLDAVRAFGESHMLNEAEELLGRTIETAAGHDDLQRACLTEELRVRLLRGDLARAARVADELEARGPMADVPALMEVSEARACTGAVDAAHAALDRASELADGDDLVQAYRLQKCRGVVLFLARDFRAAAKAFLRCIRLAGLARSAGLFVETSSAWHDLGCARLRLGETSGARVAFEQSRGLEQSLGLAVGAEEGRITLLNRMYLAYLDGLRGMPSRVVKLQQLIDDADDKGWRWDVLEGRYLLALLLEQQGAVAEAKRELEWLLEQAESRGYAFAAGDAREALEEISRTEQQAASRK